MFGNINNTTKWVGLLVLLLVANIAYYFYNNWGLVTVKVNDQPLGKIISSIEWQGWVKIYTNLPLDSKVTMYVDHVPLAEAMETLAANVDVPPPPSDGTDNGPGPNPSATPGNPGNQPGIGAGGPPGGGGFGGPAAGGPGGGGGGPGGPPGGRGGGFGGGLGGGGRAQWNLAFFVAPNAALAKQEIREFQTGDPDADAKIYTYGTQIQMIADDNIPDTPDPWAQSWSGVKPVDPSASAAPAPSAATPAAPVDAQAGAATPTATGNDPTDPPAVPTLQTYLQDFAQSANIWIMAPGSWAPEISSAPPPNSSIIRALENFVSGSHGVVIQALILRAGRGGGGGRDIGGDDSWADRMRNSINGLPPEERPEALDQLNQEIQFRKDVRTLPPDQRRQKMMQHFLERMVYGERLDRLSPVKRAQVFKRMITMRAAAKAQK